MWFASMPPDEYEETLLRWRIIAGTPSLRRRAAEFERETAGMIVGALPTSGTAEVVQAGAYLAAFTTALLAWADSGGERKLDEVFDEAFGALGG
ncbi:hypothetical protein [Blastococcus sp. TML/M2B]|uniref:acyl-CoA-like ligand-binding transcription factor n=1 Tax=Blastococcus sp. TML/M2B TaxID=2798727 RepID=UPI0035CD2FE4